MQCFLRVRPLQQLAVVAILAVLGGIGEIAILGVRVARHVFRILISKVHNAQARHGFMKPHPLIEESGAGVDFPAVCHRVPRVGTPLFLAVDLVRLSPERSGVIDRERVFSREPGKSAVEESFVAVHGARLQAASGTPNGRRRMNGDRCKAKFHSFHERRLIGVDVERRLASDATGHAPRIGRKFRRS